MNIAIDFDSIAIEFARGLRYTFCMDNFAEILLREGSFKQLLAGVRAGRTPQFAAGLSNIHKAHVIYSLCRLSGQTAHVVAPNEATAIRLCEDLNTLLGEGKALFYPSRELLFRELEGASLEYEHTRLGALGHILSGDYEIIVSSVEGACQYTLPPGNYKKATRTLLPGAATDLGELCAFLVSAGYTRSEQVEGVSQFAVRGGILDLMPPGMASPCRIEFWGDEIDTISLFDAATQRRTAELESLKITPAREALLPPLEKLTEIFAAQKKKLRGKYGALAKQQLDDDLEKLAGGLSLLSADRYIPLLYTTPASLFDYLEGALLFICEPVSMRETMTALQKQQNEDCRLLLAEGVLSSGCDCFAVDFTDVIMKINSSKSVILDNFARSLPDIKQAGLVNFHVMQLSVWGGEYSLLTEDLKEFTGRDFCVVIMAGTDRAATALCDDLVRDGFNAVLAEDVKSHIPGMIYILRGSLSAGMEYPDAKLAVITHTKMAAAPKARRRRHKEGQRIKALSELNVGDYVVHTGHGIGVFEGIVKRDMHGVIKDYIKIRYAGTDTLFVPVTQLDLVSRYIGAADAQNVRLNKLNSVDWQKTRARTKAAVKDMARELIELYAKRMNTPGFAFTEDDDMQREFEERFPYDETYDQLRCVEEIKQDMQKPSPMDRLLCGDVGFGKTEVAVRAMFKCVADGKQCAVLVPTTILAWQHFQTFRQRFEGYPIRVELLSRFRTAREQRETIRDLKKGLVDVVVGTHRVVQKDVEFKDLGLCVIDEEQRFGVAHKEKFKELRSNIDVLTLSATPIPRTLNMAMSGIRDMSIIEEAPQDRHPVQTYVLEHDPGVLEQAIRRELRRGGQVFYLHNRVDSIDSCALRLREQIPEARIMTAHGKMNEEQLSDVWKSLVEHEIDILVCTTIIETGVDVSNCNTLVIENADYMGLSQLYQLRGRVGRSTRRAYAYFTFKRGKSITEIATKRLSAIREFTTFGSGFRIAMRDLEIRGAGNILGAQQHGHMEAVGYDLYLKMLAEAVNEETGEVTKTTTECVIDIRIDAHIPEKYIESLAQRIDVYKKIASVMSQEDALDITDELIDRFGEPPASVKGLVDVALLRNTASQLGVKEIQQNDQRIILYPEQLNFAAAAHAAAALKGRVLLNAGQKPYLSLKLNAGQTPVDGIREILACLQEGA